MKIKKIYLVLFAFLPLVSCKKFLATDPDNRTDLNTPDKVSLLLAGAYPKACYASFCEAASDNSSDKGVSKDDPSRKAAYLFEVDLDDAQETPTLYWNQAYSAVAVANQALQACNEAKNPSDYSSQKGEALIARAYAHFMLVCFFSKVYDPATAGSDPGIPYVLTPEKVVFEKYSRKTVKYVYEMIEKDLKEGLPLLDDNRYTVPKYHFTKRSANAFASRFYLFKQDYQAAADAASMAFPDNSFVPNMRPILTTYKLYTAEEILINYTKATDPANLLLAEAYSRYARTYARERYGITSQLMSKILGTNVTGNGSWAYGLYNYSQDDPVILKWEEFFLKTSINATFGDPYVMVPLFTTEEVLLNRAEAYARLGKMDNAMADLNIFARQRFSGFDPARHNVTLAKAKAFYSGASDMQALVNTALDFKRAEFVFEGLRWFDVIRNKIPVSHIFYIDPNNANDVKTIDVPATDPRRVFQIPVLARQAGIEPNPR